MCAAVVTIGNCQGVVFGSINRLVVQMRRPMGAEPVGSWTGLTDSVTSVTCGSGGEANTLTSVDSDDSTQMERLDALWTAVTRPDAGDVEIRCDLTFFVTDCHLTPAPLTVKLYFSIRPILSSLMIIDSLVCWLLNSFFFLNQTIHTHKLIISLFLFLGRSDAQCCCCCCWGEGSAVYSSV